MPDRPPNLLYIFTDEQRWDTFAANGNHWLDMPHLNALADNATVFHETYCTQPVCTPSRGAMMSGLFPHTHGAVGNNVPIKADVRCFPRLLPEGVWKHGYHGKWHLGDEIFCQHGWDDWVSIEDEYRNWYSEGRDRNEPSSYTQWLRSKGVLEEDGDPLSRQASCRLPEEHGKPAFLADTASQFIKENVDQPWTLTVNFLEPHMPFFGPRDDQYDPEEVPLPSTFDHWPGPDAHMRVRLLAERYYRNGFEDNDLRRLSHWKRMNARYAGLCSLIDTHTGKILEALKASGQWDNTLIVFTSDHGEMMGSHKCVGKGNMYQESARVPLIVKAPGQTKPQRVRGPISQIDLVPTICDYLADETPEGLHGKSLRPFVEGEKDAATDPAVVCWNGKDATWSPPGDAATGQRLIDMAGSLEAASNAMTDPVRTVILPDGWRYTHSQHGWHELYDLRNDPGERRNLVHEPAFADVIKRALSHLHDWQEKAADEVPLC